MAPANWSGPVPNDAGNSAVLLAPPNPPQSIDVPSLVTLGHLNFIGPAPFSLVGAGSLRFNRPGADATLIQVSVLPRAHQVQVPISIAPGETLTADIIAGGTLSLSGGISSGDHVIKTGQGKLELYASPTWGGSLVVDAGEVVIAAANALGAGTGMVANGTRVNAGGQLRFGALVNPVGELLQLDAGIVVDRSFGVAGNTLGPIELISSSTLKNDLSIIFEPTTLAGGITGSGNLNLYGDFRISGDNTYTGETILTSDGDVIVEVTSATGLGSTVAGTVVNDSSELRLDASAAEPITIKGGRVRWRNDSQGWTGPVRLESGFVLLQANQQTFNFPINLAGSGTLSAGSGWAGTLDGIGNLRVSGRIAGDLAHQGDLLATGGTFDSANHYTGTTTIRQGTTVVNNGLAFGTSDSAIVIDRGGILQLNRIVDREILVEDGIVDIQDTLSSFTDVVRMKKGTVDWEGAAPFAGTIVLEDTTLPQGVTVRGSVFNGQITGSGQLNLSGGNGALVINTDNDYRGYTQLYGKIELNSAGGLGNTAEGSIVNAGRVVVNVPVQERLAVGGSGILELQSQLNHLPRFNAETGSPRLEIRTPSSYPGQTDIRQGILQISANTSLKKVGITDGGTLFVEEGFSLDLATDEIVISDGDIYGSVNGLESIKKVGSGGGTIHDMRNFRGNIQLAAGVLTVDDLSADGGPPTQASAQRGEIHVTSRYGAVLQGSGGVVDADIYLHDARGLARGGALNSMTVLGDLYLGDEGAYLAGEGTGVILKGGVYGGDLIFPDDQNHSEVKITGDKAAYIGETLIRDGQLHLALDGRLAETSRIVVGHGGVLFLNNREWLPSGSPPAGELDRVADDVPISMRGGEIHLWSPVENQVTENLGQVNVERGSVKIVAQASAGDPGKSLLNIGELNRQVGSTVFYDLSFPMDVHFATAPTLDDGIIGPWATVNRVFKGYYTTDFATYGPDGVRALTLFEHDIANATADENVLVAQNTTLPAGVTTINSLTVRGENQVSLDLGGQRLTVESGGIVLQGSIVNGELASGTSTNELILSSRGGEIGASIVDASDGPTALTVGSGLYRPKYRLSGVNTYSGPTTVNNDTIVMFQTVESLPSGGDMKINGGEVQLGYQSAEVKPMGSLVVRDQGRLNIRYPGSASLHFEAISLESGSVVDVKLVGDTPIVKTGDGPATLSLDGREFTGSVDVYDGTLVVEGSSIGNQDVTVHGGRLIFQGRRNDSGLPLGDVHLNGGEFILESTYKGTVYVNAPSRISGGNFIGLSRLGEPQSIVGASDLILGGRIDLETPNLELTSDITVEGTIVTRHAAGLGSGTVTVAPGGILELAYPGGGDLSNDVILAGGELTTAREQALTPYAGRLFGKVTVTDDSVITTNFRDPMEIAGELTLRDGVRLTKRQEGLLTISGDILVGGDVDFLLGPGFRRHTDEVMSQDVVSDVHVTGVIKSAAQQATLNFQRTGFDRLELTASVVVESGQSLAIFEDGAAVPFVVGSGATISGSGSFVNPVQVVGGTLSPGQSPGVLSFADDLVIGPGTTYEWEINNALGQPGQEPGWDLIQVAEQLVFDLAGDDLFTVRISGLNGLNDPGRVVNFDPTLSHQWLIATADSIQGFDPSRIRFDFSESQAFNSTFRARNFSLRVDNGSLYSIINTSCQSHTRYCCWSASC